METPGKTNNVTLEEWIGAVIFGELTSHAMLSEKVYDKVLTSIINLGRNICDALDDETNRYLIDCHGLIVKSLEASHIGLYQRVCERAVSCLKEKQIVYQKHFLNLAEEISAAAAQAAEQTINESREIVDLTEEDDYIVNSENGTGEASIE